MSEQRVNSNKESRNPLVRFFANLGPGLITSAADDDPSGIACVTGVAVRNTAGGFLLSQSF
jgi:Mn2+/Fe2+ NRAMP family transporter